MNVEVIVAIIGLVGSAIGTFGGILIANRLTTYRLEQLEKKVDKHNNLIERMYVVEKRVTVNETKIEQAGADFEDLKTELRRFLKK